MGAAFDIFAGKGFHGATMLEIANRARASKKTLYARFADKADLFRALVAWGCRRNLPDALPAKDAEPRAALERHALTVLRAIYRPEAMALQRIVVSEARHFPEIGALFDAMTRAGSVAIVEEIARRLGIRERKNFAEDFIALARGDLYFRVLAGALPPPGDAALAAQARRSVGRLLEAYSV